MSSTFQIRTMKENEIQIAIDWAKAEGWNPGLLDAECFYKADPKGFFIGFLEGYPIAVGSAVVYDEHFAFCGLYIVEPEYRGQGYGIQLTQERLKYTGDRVTGIDGVLENVEKYERLGYVVSHKNVRYVFTPRHYSSQQPNIVDLKTVPFEQLEAFDRVYFPAPRPAFLKCWINNKVTKALGYVEKGKLRGYGVIRQGVLGYKIGPLFAETPVIAQLLLADLTGQLNEGPVYLDIPEPNLQAKVLIQHYNMTPHFVVVRMYRNGAPDIDLDGVYGVTSFELG